MRRLNLLLIIMVLLAGSVYAMEPEPKQVDPSEVCMVNDTIMGKPQIPVEVDGKKYYGCCQGCVVTLKKNPASRFARDPLTGRRVDKSEAFIIQGPRGRALYFESSQTAMRYLQEIKRD